MDSSGCPANGHVDPRSISGPEWKNTHSRVKHQSEERHEKSLSTIYHQEVVMYDLKNLGKMKNLEAHAPEAMKAFVAFDKAALPRERFRESIRS